MNQAPSCEPASAASVAGVIQKNKTGYFTEGRRRIVCILTGHGLKDPDIIVKQFTTPRLINPGISALEDALKLGGKK